MAIKPSHVFALLALFLIGCAAQQPLVRFESLPALQGRPRTFDQLADEPGQVQAKISLRAPGLRGAATGIVRHAKGGQYLIELYGRGELFLKVYFTGTQTVLWPATGMPTVFAADSTPSLQESVHLRLPNWRLDDLLPVSHVTADKDASIEWAGYDDRAVCECIKRDHFDPLYKSYSKPTDNRVFPFGKVVLQTATGSSRLTWSLRQTK